MSLGVFQVTAPLPECHQAAKVATTKSVTIATQSDRHREGIKYVCFFFYQQSNYYDKIYNTKSNEKSISKEVF